MSHTLLHRIFHRYCTLLFKQLSPNICISTHYYEKRKVPLKRYCHNSTRPSYTWGTKSLPRIVRDEFTIEDCFCSSLLLQRETLLGVARIVEMVMDYDINPSSALYRYVPLFPS